MEAYIYAADFICYDCAQRLIRDELREWRKRHGFASSQLKDMRHFNKYLKESGRDPTTCYYERYPVRTPNWDEYDAEELEALESDTRRGVDGELNGPHADGGGESDSPAHCSFQDKCVHAWKPGGKFGKIKVGCFLENPLTEDGYRYVREYMRDDPDSPVVQLWAKYYEMEQHDYGKEARQMVGATRKEL